MAQNTIPEIFLAGNEKWRPSWKTPPTMPQIRQSGQAPNSPLMVVTCMDPRCEPTQFLGGELLFGTVKNAGGRATDDAIRSLLVLRSLTQVSEGGTIAVVHHTDCGMTHLTDHQIMTEAQKRTPSEADRAAKIEFGCFKAEDFEETIRKDVRKLKADKLLAGMDIMGFAFITETGELHRVED